MEWMQAIGNWFNRLMLEGALSFWQVLLIAVALDMIIGDPHWFPHPVKLIGKWISWFEKKLRQKISQQPSISYVADERRAGTVLCAVTVVGSGLIVGLILALINRFSPFWASVAAAVMMYWALSGHALWAEASKVAKALEADDITLARQRIGYLVGRDTEKLSRQGVARACCETVAENTNDGLVAPLFFMVVGYAFFDNVLMAAAVVWAYKAASTLDSMVGYHNAKYENFGRSSARLDDILAFLPARICGALMPLSALILNMRGKIAFNTALAENNKHHSPNSGWCEAAAAGALGIRMGGGAYYGGVWRQAPSIGCDIKAPDAKDIRKCSYLMAMTGLLTVLIGMLGHRGYTILLLIAAAMTILGLRSQLRAMGMGFRDLFRRR